MPQNSFEKLFFKRILIRHEVRLFQGKVATELAAAVFEIFTRWRQDGIRKSYLNVETILARLVFHNCIGEALDT